MKNDTKAKMVVCGVILFGGAMVAYAMLKRNFKDVTFEGEETDEACAAKRKNALCPHCGA